MDLPLWEPWDDPSHVMPFDRNYGDSWLFDHCSAYGTGSDLVFHVSCFGCQLNVCQCHVIKFCSLVDNQSGFCIGDHWLSDLYFWRDVIEEDALNEKCCVQVLKILMEKADEEIIQLEEDIVMLQCQLACEDEDWSKLCSAAIREQIDHLDELIQTLNMDNTELEQVTELPPRLHDLVKPLLENYFSAKTKRTEESVTQMPDLCAADLSNKSLGAVIFHHDKKLDEKDCINLLESNERNGQAVEPKYKNINNLQQVPHHDKKLDEKDCINLLKNNERNSQVVEPKAENINNPKEKKDAIVMKCIPDAHDCLHGNLPGKDLNNLNTLQRKRAPISAPAKSGQRSFNKPEQSNPITKTSSTSTIDRGSFRGRSKSNKTDKEVSPAETITQCKPQRESLVTNTHLESQVTKKTIAETVKYADAILDAQPQCREQTAEASSKTQNAGTDRYVIGGTALLTNQLATMKRRTRYSEKTQALKARSTEGKDANSESLALIFSDIIKHTGKPKMKVEPKFEIKNLIINQANSISSFKAEKKCRAAPETGGQLCLTKGLKKGSSFTETLKGQRDFGVPKRSRKRSKKDTQQDLSRAVIDISSDETTTSFPSTRKKRKSASSSQSIRNKKGIRNFLMKLENPDDDIPNTPFEKATDNHAAKDLAPISPLCIKDRSRLLVKDLKAMAKSRKIPYSGLRKAELQKLLGLQPEETYEKKGRQDSSLALVLYKGNDF